MHVRRALRAQTCATTHDPRSYVAAVRPARDAQLRSHKPVFRADLPAFVETRLDAGEISHRLILIGDAGLRLAEEPVLRTLGQWAARIPQKTTVVFLGDDIYESGMPEAAAAGRREAERRLMAKRKNRPVLTPLPPTPSLATHTPASPSRKSPALLDTRHQSHLDYP